ncbi:MAG: hypothetical protein ACJ73E_08045 [Mycobacteriales bacterium]
MDDEPGELGRELAREVLDVTLEEFRLTESRFETDARLGRELLYLVSNNEWVRRTTEILDLSRVAAVETRVVVDVDVSYIAHEALRAVAGPIWLPLIALPRQLDAGPGGPAADAPDTPVSIDVTDSSGSRVAEVPPAEVGRQLAAALSEVLISRLYRRTSVREGEGGPATRDAQVLLAAVLARVLTRAPRDATGTAGVPRPTGATPRGNRLRLAQSRLRERLEAEVEAAIQEDARRRQPDADLADADSDARSTLTSREAEIVQAIRGSTLVVVPVDPAGPPTSFTVGMPARALVRTPPGRHASVARVRVALLAPSTHADRVVEVLIPDGVRSLDADGSTRSSPGADARIEVRAPQQFEQLRLLLDRMLRPRRPPHGWVRKQLAEMAVVKLHAVIHCLRHHYMLDGDPARTERLMQALQDLREPLDAEAHGRVVDLAGAWSRAVPLLPQRLLRRLDRSTASPGSVRFRATAIEEFTLRSEPTEAYVELVVVPGESPTLGTARAVNGINVLVLAGITTLLMLGPAANGSRADVLATLLTIFPTIQASRLRQPDATRLAGLLTMRHFKVGLLTAVPGLMLAGVLAFAPEGGWLLAAALLAVALQLACHLWIRQLGESPAGRALRRRRPRVALETVRTADHAAFDVLRSAWCRSLTGDVLLLGRTAHPYVVVDRDEPGSLTDLLTGAQGELTEALPGPRSGLRRVLRDFRLDEPVVPRVAAMDGSGDEPVNLLGMLRGTAIGRSATFLVFRDLPKPDWLAAAGRMRDPTGHPAREIRPVALDRGRQAPLEPPDWVLDVMIGIPAGTGDPPFGRHPLVLVAAAADRANFTLLNVQLPAPPPLQDVAERQWLRLRVGVPYRRGDSLRKLVRFLAALDALGREDALVHLREVPQMETLDATQTAPEDSFDELPGARVPSVGKTRAGRLVTDADVRVPARPADDWRLVAVCAPPRSGLLAELLAALPEQAGTRSLAGAVSGVLNGTAVIFLLCRPEPAAAGWDPGAVERRLERALQPHRTVVQLLEEVRPTMLGGAPRPLLRVQIRTPDRPGVMQDLLRELGRQVHREAHTTGGTRLLVGADGPGGPGGPGGARPDRPELRLVATGRAPAVDVLYALTPVVDGQALSGRLLLRLPHHDRGDERWVDVDWQHIGRVVAQAVTRPVPGGRTVADAERTSRLSDDTVVTLDLVRRPSTAEPAATTS